jgi:hypothetical protein
MENLENEQKQEKEKPGALGWITTIIGLISLIIFIVVPFCTKLNGCLAKWLWWPSAVIILIVSMYSIADDCQKDKRQGIVDLIYSLAGFVIFGSWFIINFYETEYNWKWFIFVTILILMPMGSWLCFDWHNSRNNYDQNIVTNSRKANAKACVYFLFVSLFYLSFLLDNLILRFVFGGLAMIYLFYNIVYAFLNVKSISKHSFGFITDLMVAIALTVYLIYIIPKGTSTLQEIILAIVGTIYAGFIPLVGVAWTLKHTEKLRNEENKLKIKPVFYYLEEEKDLSREIVYVSTFSDEEEGKLNCFSCGKYKNTENGILILKRIIAENNCYNIYMNKVIEKNVVFTIGIQTGKKPADMRNFILQVEDIEGNEYSYRITLENNDYRKIVEIK